MMMPFSNPSRAIPEAYCNAGGPLTAKSDLSIPLNCGDFYPASLPRSIAAHCSNRHNPSVLISLARITAIHARYDDRVQAAINAMMLACMAMAGVDDRAYYQNYWARLNPALKSPQSVSSSKLRSGPHPAQGHQSAGARPQKRCI